MINFIPYSTNNVASKADYHFSQSLKATNFFAKIALKIAYAFFAILSSLYQFFTGIKLMPAKKAHIKEIVRFKPAAFQSQKNTLEPIPEESEDKTTTPCPAPAKTIVPAPTDKENVLSQQMNQLETHMQEVTASINQIKASAAKQSFLTEFDRLTTIALDKNSTELMKDTQALFKHIYRKFVANIKGQINKHEFNTDAIKVATSPDDRAYTAKLLQHVKDWGQSHLSGSNPLIGKELPTVLKSIEDNSKQLNETIAANKIQSA
jgi:hypothetical protein